MAGEKQKCPLCGTKLKMKDGRWTCKECGYYMRESSEQSASFGTVPNSEPIQQNSTASPSGADLRQTQQAQQAPSPQYTPAQAGQQYGGANPKPVKSNGNALSAVRIVIIVVVLTALAVIRSLVAANLNRDSSTTSTDDMVREILDNNELTVVNNSDSQTGNSSSDQASFRYTPQSGFFQAFAEVIFEKPYTEITREEYASLTALQIDLDENNLYYQINHADGTPLTFGNSTGMDLSDLRYFTGLEYISLVGEGFERGDLDGLLNLRAVYSENTLSELTSIVPYPENITDLGYVASFFDKDLSGIENFPNLEYLTVESNQLNDISALNAFPNLMGLALYDCDDLMDYSPLMSMTTLEELTIYSSQLKTIDFIKVMPNLIYLDIEDSQISSVDALSSCPKLRRLYLMNNYSVTDYSPVGDLENLEVLTLYKSFDAEVPSLEKLAALKRASFRYLDEYQLSLVTAASNIEQLYLEHCYDQDLALLSTLPLYSLSLVDCSYYTQPLLEPLAQLPLTYLDLSDTYVFGNVEVVFGIPTLQYLYLDEGNGIINFDNLPDNENLRVLSMCGYEIDVEPYNNTLHEQLSDHYDMFDHFPNLEEVYVADMKIDSIDFVEKLPHLMFLDITQNNVTSLKPLESLNYFDTVWCGGNTILEWVSEDSDIYVDSESYYYGY